MTTASIPSLVAAHPASATPAARAGTVDQTAAALRVGARVQARVVAVPGNGRPVQLAVAGLVLSASTELPLKQGDELRLQVIEGGARPVLRVLDLNSPHSSTDLRTRALRLALGRQSALLPAIEALHTATTRPIESDPTTPAQRRAVQSIIAGLARATALTQPVTLRETIGASGLFLEAQLASLAKPDAHSSLGPANTLPRDLKAALLRALATVASPTEESGERPNSRSAAPIRGASSNANPMPAPTEGLTGNARPGTARQAIEGALARITAHQLQALTDPNAAAGQILNIELPILREGRMEPMRLRIRRDGPDAAQGSEQPSASRWEVEIATEITPLGPVHGRIGFYRQHVTVNLWAELRDTYDLLARESDRLSASLGADGLSVHAVRCHFGTPPERPTGPSQELFGAHA